MSEPVNWSTTAINLPEHADNKIHTDEGARAAGFDSALVAGTTVYAYMTHPAAAAWGLDWVGGGGGELRLRRPVFDRDPVDCIVDRSADGVVVSASVAGDTRATLELWKQSDAPEPRAGDPLEPLDFVLGETEAGYGTRCGDDLSLYAEQGIAHPVLWANLANRVFMKNLVTGPWIHTKSRIFHQGLAALGADMRVDATLVERFDSRAGERALVDISMYADGAPVAMVEHEAIIVLPS